MYNTITVDGLDRLVGRYFLTRLYSQYSPEYDRLRKILHKEFPKAHTRRHKFSYKEPVAFDLVNNYSIIIIFADASDLLMFTLKYSDQWKLSV